MPEIETPPQAEVQAAANSRADQKDVTEPDSGARLGRLHLSVEFLSRLLNSDDFFRGNCFRN